MAASGFARSADRRFPLAARLLRAAGVTALLLGSTAPAAFAEPSPAGRAHVAAVAAHASTTPAWDGRLRLLQQGGSAAASGASTLPMGNMNQLMRSIFFPNANMVFNVQLEDPGAKPVAGQKGGNFSITAWGDNLYSRWEIVSYAAVALEESAILLNRPGRLCANGKPVPVDRADWGKFVAELGDTAKVIYTASVAKDRDKVVDLTERLNDSCQACHNAYRRGADEMRCTPK